MVQVLTFIAVSLVIIASVMVMNVQSREKSAELFRKTNISIASDQDWAQDRFIIQESGGLDVLSTLENMEGHSKDGQRLPASALPNIEMEKEVVILGKRYRLEKTFVLKRFKGSDNKVDYLLVTNDYYEGDKLVFSKPRVLSK